MKEGAPSLCPGTRHLYGHQNAQTPESTSTHLPGFEQPRGHQNACCCAADGAARRQGCVFSSPEEAQQPDGQVEPQRRIRAVLLPPARQARRSGRHQLPQAAGSILLHKATATGGDHSHGRCGVLEYVRLGLRCCNNNKHSRSIQNDMQPIVARASAMHWATQSPRRPLALGTCCSKCETFTERHTVHSP